MAMRKAYIDVRHGQVHARVCAGSDAEAAPLVLLHKTASSSRSFEAMMLRLEGQRPLIALDTPGFGESFAPGHVPDTAYFCRVLLEALDRLGVARFHLLGHHTGSNLGTQIAAITPERVLSLAMIGIPLLTAAEREAWRGRYGDAFNRPVADGSHLQKTWDYLARMGAGRSLELQQRELLDHLRAWRARQQAYAVVWDQDFAAHFARVRCPMLLMCAHDDVLWPFFARSCKACPEAGCVVVEGANFEPDLDPGRCPDATLAFLAGRP
jgi:pimeloyl-ACP methyl ester carboxylesterase